MRKFYTDDAGFALATQVDSDLVTLWEGFSKTSTAGVAGATGAAMLWEKAVIGSVMVLRYILVTSSNAADITRCRNSEQ